MIKWLWLPVLAVASLPATALADDNYVIGKGDVVEINVLNLPALHRRLTVGPDGKIAVPPLGTLVAAGLTADQLQSAMQKQLIERNIARDPDVVVEIAEYRPVFLDGDVAKPGEYGYRAELTVRKAVAIAGGYGPLAELHGLTPLMEAATAKGDVGSLAIEVARQRLRMLRLNAELADEPELAIAHSTDGAVDPELFADLAKTEVGAICCRQGRSGTQRAYLQRMLQTAQSQLEFLSRAGQEQQQALSQQMDDTARARELLQRGMGTVTRTEDEERAIGMLQWQNLDVQARLQQANGQIADATRQLQGYDDQRKIRLLNRAARVLSRGGEAGPTACRGSRQAEICGWGGRDCGIARAGSDLSHRQWRRATAGR